MSAETLVLYDLEKERVVAIPSKWVNRDRTYSTAVSVRNWIRARRLDVRSMDTVSIGIHGKRTQVLFEQAIGLNVEIGIISITDQDYDPDRWWATSEGMKAMLSESIAYVYARFFLRRKMSVQAEVPVLIGSVVQLRVAALVMMYPFHAIAAVE